MMIVRDRNERAIKRLRTFKYHWCLVLAAVSQIIFTILFLRSQCQVDNNCNNTSSVSNDEHLSLSFGNETLAQQIVKSSYRNSGFQQFAEELCPAVADAEILPSRFRNDFVEGCLRKAYESSSNQSAVFHEKSPWWFKTLLRDLGNFDTGRFPELVGRWHNLQFNNVGSEAAPQRLQICVYEKGGTKSWRDMQCDHQGLERRDDGCWKSQPPYDEILSARLGLNSTAAYKSDKAVFLRDPLERFLSGFLDKCVGRNKDEGHCQPISVFQSEDSNMKDLMMDKKTMFQAYVDGFPLKWDQHFFPQSFYCGGLYRTIGDYDFVGNMGKRFYHDLIAMQKQYPGLKPAMERTFELSKKNLNSPNKGTETFAAAKLRKYYTPHTVRRVLEYYAIDYVSLGLPIPEWAEEMLLQE